KWKATSSKTTWNKSTKSLAELLVTKKVRYEKPIPKCKEPRSQRRHSQDIVCSRRGHIRCGPKPGNCTSCKRCHHSSQLLALGRIRPGSERWKRGHDWDRQCRFAQFEG